MGSSVLSLLLFEFPPCIVFMKAGLKVKVEDMEFVLPDHSVEILAKVKIKAGREITNQYHKPDKAAFIRRQTMKWFLDCSCPRCMDPTELGSHYSSLLSPKLCGGVVVSLEPVYNTADWACQQCGDIVSYNDVKSIIERSESEIDNPAPLDGPVEHCERVLHSLSSTFHPGNFLLLQEKQKLAMMYGNMMPYTPDKMSSPARERKIKLCHDVISSLSKLKAGLSTWHIAMLTELAKMPDPHLSKENNDPGGKKGMMARFLFMDKVLTGVTCLNTRSNRVQSTDLKDPKVEIVAGIAVRDNVYQNNVDHTENQDILNLIHKSSELKQLVSDWEKLSVVSLDSGKLILRNNEILIPKEAKAELVNQLHLTHLGSALDRKYKSCEACNSLNRRLTH